MLLWIYGNTTKVVLIIAIQLIKYGKLKTALATCEMRQRKPVLNIKGMIDIVLDEFGCANDKNYFVTDSTRNMITACNDEERY